VRANRESPNINRDSGLFIDSIWTSTKSAAFASQDAVDEIDEIRASFQNEKELIEFFYNLEYLLEATINSSGGNNDLLNEPTAIRDLAMSAKSYVDANLDIENIFSSAKNNQLNESALNLFHILGLHKTGILSANDISSLSFDVITDNTINLIPENQPLSFSENKGMLSKLQNDASIFYIVAFDNDRASEIHAREMLDFVRRYKYLFPGDTDKFFVHYLLDTPPLLWI